MSAFALRRMLLFTAAFALSLATALIVRSWVKSARLAAAAVPVMAEPVKVPAKLVLIAATDLPAGHLLKPQDMKWVSWPDSDINDAYILQGTRPTEQLVGSVVRLSIVQGDPITEARLGKKGDRGFLAAVLDPGTRAVTVQLSANAGLGGLVLPGDHVDVLLTADVQSGGEGKSDRRVSETVLTDIRVIAIDQRLNDLSNETVMARTATLEVTPKQAEILALVTEMGKLSMSLRGISDAGDADQTPGKPSVTWDNDATDIGLRPRDLMQPRASNTPARVDIVRGAKQQQVEFQKDK